MVSPEGPKQTGWAQQDDATKWKRSATLLALLLLVLIAAVFIVPSLRNAFGLRTLDSAAVVTEVRELKQLVTVRYSIQRVVGMTEPKEPFGSESILLMVQGEVLAGVDLASINSRDIAYSGARSVSISLPPAKIFDSFLDEKQTKVWDRHITWWTPWAPYDLELEHKARLAALKDVRDAALSMGILNQAQKNAECAIAYVLKAVNMDVRFRTKPS